MAEKPPYAAASVIDEFFRRIDSLKPPAKTDSTWAKDQGLDPKHLASIPSMLRWLGVVDENYKPDAKIWNDLRLRDRRPAVLAERMRAGYVDIFNQLEIEKADKGMLHSAFVQAYNAGDTGRQIVAFLTLAKYAGIETAATVGTTTKASKEGSAPAALKAPSTRRASNQRGVTRRSQPRGEAGAIGVTLTVEIPAEWDEAQVAERVAAVRRALSDDGS